MDQRLEHGTSMVDMESLNSLTSSPPPSFTHPKLSSREMDSLVAISDTFFPSLVDTIDQDETVKMFLFTSASMLGIPDTVGSYMSAKLHHPRLWLMRVALWFLSTWYGTLAICGVKSLSWRFPYVKKFSDVELRKREEILLSLSHSSFFLYRMLFKALKFLVSLFYFTQVDDKNQNPTWKAIGYCGPDPNFTKPRQTDCTITQNQGSDNSEDSLFGPLHGSILHLHHPKDAITATLAGAGLSLSSHPSSLPTIRCDAVVVGSGSGGGVVAGVLASAGYKVVVVEKGPYLARNGLPLLEGHAMDAMYEGSGLLATKDVGVVVLAGSTVGGGSHINWAASLRTPEHVIREWAVDHELELFASEMYRQAMDVVCGRMGVQEDVTYEGLSNAVLRRGCEELGYHVANIPRNAAKDHDCGWCCFGCRKGKKKGTSETWLVDAVRSGNAVILPECEAVKVVHSRRRNGGKTVARGVVVECRDGRRYAVESRVTVVACGALNTPALLRKSGLRNRSIGRNLHLHPVVMGWGTFGEEEKKKSYEGAIMTAMCGGGERDGVVIQTPALHPGMFSTLMPWVNGEDFKERMCKFSRTAHVFALVRDVGCGRAELPKSLEYDLDARDEEKLQGGLEKVLRMLAAAGADEIGTHHCGGRMLRVKEVSSHEFEKFVKKESHMPLRDLSTPICSAHQMGTCRMGVDPRDSVVGATGETWEVEGLYVADTSVFPTALGVNPMVTVQSIAYCTAQSILGVLHRRCGRRSL